MIVREITTLDAEKFAHLTLEVDNSSEYMLWEPGERKIDIEQQRKRIESISKEENSTIFVAEENNELSLWQSSS